MKQRIDGGRRRVGALLLAAALVSAMSGCKGPGAQGWTAEERASWYGASQGSRLIPLSWLEALEQAGDTARFLDPASIALYRYLPAAASESPLPLGFVVDVQDDCRLSTTKLRWKADQGSSEPWVGLNCAACHTAEMTYQGKVIRADGGPTLADLQGFFEALNRALVETRDEPARLERFARRVLGPDFDAANQGMLETALAQQLASQDDILTMNAPPMRYGYGRFDAIGFIFNKASRVANGHARSANPASAPVSYPFLWNVPQHDRVQWNGMAQNLSVEGIGGQPLDLGALGRNVGEVVGVLADITPVADAGPRGFVSSVDIPNLVAIEQLLGRLEPPEWPADILGAIDPERQRAGEALFQQHCVSCHAHLDRDDLSTPIKAVMTRLNDPRNPRLSIGTDPWMACNAYTYEATSGVLAGTRSKYFAGEPIGDTAHLADMLTIEVAGAISARNVDLIRAAVASFFGGNRPPKVTAVTPSRSLGPSQPAPPVATPSQRLERCMTDDSELLAYKGRPLTGIWATAPYLHNGSVPTLYDLLLPPDLRPTSFAVGTREFDPVQVGYVTTPSADNAFTFTTRDPAGAPISGNSNLGHDYGNGGFSDEQRRALVEYMKGL